MNSASSAKSITSAVVDKLVDQFPVEDNMEISLLNSGFIKCCETEFVHPGVGITVELTSDGLGSIEANGVDSEAIGAFVVLDLEAHSDRSLFGHRLVIGIKDMRQMSSTSALSLIHI